MATYILGTAGWSFEFWNHKFYPRGTKRQLEYYAGEGPIVEINTTFYNFPKSALVHSWYEQTPPEFSFSAKMHREVTHQSSVWQIHHYDLDVFFSSLDPLQEKLRFILLQMPPHFQKSELNLDFMGQLITQCRRRTTATIAVEFRHISWFEEDTYRLLGDCMVVITPFLHVSLQEQLEMHLRHLQNSVYIRLFGSRSEMPDDKLGVLRLDRNRELQRFTEILHQNDMKLDEVHIFLTNQFSGYAPGDAYELHKLMEKRGMDVRGFSPKLTLDDFF